MVMLVGEPGIGKTAVCERLVSIARDRGGLGLVGHCYQQGSANVPYQPFVEILEQCASEQDPDALYGHLGAYAVEIARIVPVIRDRLQIALTATQDAKDDPRRLFAAVLNFLRRVADANPLVLVVEDLHDAERGTLDLLLYLARNVTTCRLLLVCTYRDVEVDRAHPLSAALVDLRRANNLARVHLTGLSIDEVQRLLAAASGHVIPRTLAELVHRRTEGNPLFSHELLRLLVVESLLEERDGVLRRVGDQTITGRMPEGLRDAVGRRLSTLSDNANRVLSVASVIGREFDLDVLRQVYERGDDELETGLEEAVSAAILEERRVIAAKITYRFTHAFFRQTLYQEIIAPRRLRLHRQIAHILEDAYAARIEEHAAELAEHYSFSSDTGDLSKALQYARVAARHASDVFAYGEGARQLERALQMLELVDPEDDASRCDLLLDLAEELSLAGDAARSIADVAPEALRIADRMGDRHRAFRACRLIAVSLEVSGASSSMLSPDYLAWAERAAAYAEPATVEEAHANLALAHAWVMRGRPQEGRARRIQTLSLAQKLGDQETRFQCAGFLIMGFGSTAPRYWPERLELAKESVTWPRAAVSGRALAHVLWYAGRIALANGDRPRAIGLWKQVSELADRTHLGFVEQVALESEIVLAILDGRLAEAWTMAERFVIHADEVGASRRGREISMYLFLALAEHLGRFEECYAKFDGFATQGLEMNHPLPIAYCAICLAQSGRIDEARTRAAPLLQQERVGRADDPRDINWLMILLECALVLNDHDAATALAEPLVSVAHLSTADWIMTTVARQLGAVAALNGDLVGARSFLLQGLEAGTRIGFRPEIAILHVQLAELLLKDADRLGALQHVDLALPELEQMQMQPWLERELHVRESAEALPGMGALDGLTPREREVAVLLAEGQSNREIATQLVITEGTAEVHVKRILSKLGLHSRSQIAAWMAEQHRTGAA
jgi:DNA-binding CsgD family transcriptional regulator